jgi:MFS family permease
MNATVAEPMPGFLSRERIVAGPRFNRWLVPPAALAIHLCIGMAYGFSVFWLPLSKSIGITQSVACPAGMSTLAQLFTTACDWKVSMLGWTYTLFFVLLGLSAATWGGWLERAGPRKAGVVSAVCWCGGFVISSVGVMTHQLWLMWLGSGVIGGIGLGLGYISPVSTLIKWFPDRRGMATGMAIMGFGGGAMIGSPLADRLMKLYASPTSVGVWETFLTLAAIYFVFMICGASAIACCVKAGDRRAGHRARVAWPHHTAQRAPRRGVAHEAVPGCYGSAVPQRQRGHRHTGQASPLQEVFAGRLIGVDASFTELNAAQLAQSPPIAAGFTGCCHSPTFLGAFSGPRCRIASAARRRIRCSSCSASHCIRRFRGRLRRAASRCSLRSSS